MSRRQNIVSEISNDFLTCHICLETYDKPKTLNCGHFFCRDCLFNYFRQSQQTAQYVDGTPITKEHCRLYCPTCRVEVGIDKKGSSVAKYVDDLPDNFYVNSLKDLVADHSTRRSTRSRSDRGEGLNAQHVSAKNLARSKSTSDTFQTESSSDVDQGGVQCAAHPRWMINLFCQDHVAVLCERCRLLDHKDCAGCISLKEAENTFIRPRVQQVIESINSRRSSLLESIRTLTLEGQRLQIDSFAIEKQVDDMKVKLQAKISQNFREIGENLSTVKSDMERKATQELESAKMKESIMTETAENLQTLAMKENVLELASALSMVDAPILGESIEHHSCSRAIHYKPNEFLASLLSCSENMFGDITTVKIQKTSVKYESEEQGATAKPVLAPTKTIKDSAWEDCGISIVTNSNVPAMSTECNKDELKHNQDGPTLSLASATINLSPRMESSSRFCILKNGDIAILDSVKSTVTWLSNSGIVLASLDLPSTPLGLTTCKDSKRKTSLVVSSHGCTIHFLSTISRIKLVYTRLTRVQYSDITGIPKRLSLLAMAEFENPPFLDLVSLQGQVLRTFQTTSNGIRLFVAPKRIATSSEYIFVLDNNCLKLVSWESELVRTINTFVEFELGNISAICGSRHNNACILVDSKYGRVFSLMLEGNDWKLEKIFDDTSIVEPCDISSGKIGFAIFVAGSQIRMFSHPGLSKGQPKPYPVSRLQEKYQTH